MGRDSTCTVLVEKEEEENEEEEEEEEGERGGTEREGEGNSRPSSLEDTVFLVLDDASLRIFVRRYPATEVGRETRESESADRQTDRQESVQNVPRLISERSLNESRTSPE